MPKIFALMVTAAALAGCTSQTQLYYDYAHGTEVVVPAQMSGLNLEKVAVFESPRHPGRLLVAPGHPSLMRIRTRYPTTDAWLGAVPTFEDPFRAAALHALDQQGRKRCSIGKFTPVPEKAALEFEYECGSSI